ncbi:MAG: hypothetical protein JW797_13175 [Bradymonadales bacterium]|nr:hypothetical protein [Bradymonadales bacterium]
MSPPARHPAIALVIAGLLVGTGVGLLIWRLRTMANRSEPSQEPIDLTGVLQFAPFTFDVGLLEAQWEEQRNRVPSFRLGEPEGELIQAVREYNRAVGAGSITYEQGRALSDLMAVTVSQYISLRGPEWYRELGWTQLEPFLEAVWELERRVEEREGTGDAWLDLAAPQSRNIIENIGNFYDFAKETGLIDLSGRIQLSAELLAILFRYRWFSFAEEYANLALMAPYERAVFWRWRIEVAMGFSLEERLAMVDRAEVIYREEGFDPDQVRGILAYQAGDLELARSFFRRALGHDPHNDRLVRAWELLSH